MLLEVESHFLDFKARAIRPNKLTKTISAFANADGGDLFIGVRESGNGSYEWDGFVVPEDANSHLQVFEALFPLGGDYRYSFLKHPDMAGYVLQIIINKTKAIVETHDKIPYIRRGAQNLPVKTHEQLSTLKRNKGIMSYETESVSTELFNVTNSCAVIEFILDVVPTAEPEEWLRKQELIREGKPTVACVVLFADLPQAIMPKRTGLKIYRYKTSVVEGTRDTLVDLPITIEGCAYEIIKHSVQMTKEIIGNIRKLGPAGFESITYPTETLHEVITNAILHRDYSIADDVHVRIFDNRVEVESPGRLPAHITTANILHERFSRNGTLVRIINKFRNPPNMDIGEGLNTAFAAMKKLRLKEPIVQERDNSVVVQIKHERLSSAEELVMEYLQESREITNGIARQLTGITSENSMKLVFYKLRDQNLIEPVADRHGSASAWQKKEATNQAPT